MNNLLNLISENNSLLKRIVTILSLDSKLYFTVDDVAEILNREPDTVRKYCNKRKLKHSKLFGKIIIKPIDLECWLDKQLINVPTDSEIESSAKEYIANK